MRMSDQWPAEQRVYLCHGGQNSRPHHHKLEGAEGCDVRAGQPSRDFWDLHAIHFTSSRHINALPSLSSGGEATAEAWRLAFPLRDFSVLAVQSPARFPVLARDRGLAQFLDFTPAIQDRATAFISALRLEVGGSVLAVHLRRGADWEKACRHGEGQPRYMASPQCLEGRPGATVTQSMCYPDLDQITTAIRGLLAVRVVVGGGGGVGRGMECACVCACACACAFAHPSVRTPPASCVGTPPPSFPAPCLTPAHVIPPTRNCLHLRGGWTSGRWSSPRMSNWSNSP
jgi:hypothetical protein